MEERRTSFSSQWPAKSPAGPGNQQQQLLWSGIDRCSSPDKFAIIHVRRHHFHLKKKKSVTQKIGGDPARLSLSHDDGPIYGPYRKMKIKQVCALPDIIRGEFLFWFSCPPLSFVINLSSITELQPARGSIHSRWLMPSCWSIRESKCRPSFNIHW